jgi:tRNA nucleotidyltransferase (CCA-adding enzyme)
MISLPQQAQSIITSITKEGYEAFAVGGSVRDILMKRETRQWDFTTNAKPEEILSLFPDSFYDNQFGTVGVKIRNPDNTVNDVYEITTYRSEKGYSDHRHPDAITWGKTIEEDLARRDFTINAIATDGKILIDPHGGQKDITHKLIQTVGNASDRFGEDALRMMRAVRIASEIGFKIEENTLEAIRKNSALLANISIERIRDEFVKLLSSAFASDGILMLKNTGLMLYVLPEFEKAFTISQKSPHRHHLYDVGTHSVMALKHCPSNDPYVRLATLLHDIGKVPTYRKDDKGNITFYNHEVESTKIAKSICKRLRLSNKQTDRVLTLVRWHQFTVDERQTDSAIRRFVRHVGKENIDDMLALRIGDRLGGGAKESSWRLELFKKRLGQVQKQPFSVTDLAIDGNDVMKILECKPGPVVGETLNQLFSEVENGRIANKREVLLKKLQELQPSVSKS